VAVEGEAVAVRAERDAGGIIAPPQTGQRVGIGGVVAQRDGAQGPELIVDEAQDVVEPLTGIGDELADDEAGETTPQF